MKASKQPLKLTLSRPTPVASSATFIVLIKKSPVINTSPVIWTASLTATIASYKAADDSQSPYNQGLLRSDWSDWADNYE